MPVRRAGASATRCRVAFSQARIMLSVDSWWNVLRERWASELLLATRLMTAGWCQTVLVSLWTPAASGGWAVLDMARSPTECCRATSVVLGRNLWRVRSARARASSTPW